MPHTSMDSVKSQLGSFNLLSMVCDRRRLCQSTWIGNQSLNRAVLFVLLFLLISFNMIDLDDLFRYYRTKTYLPRNDDANRRAIAIKDDGGGGGVGATDGTVFIRRAGDSLPRELSRALQDQTPWPHHPNQLSSKDYHLHHRHYYRHHHRTKESTRLVSQWHKHPNKHRNNNPNNNRTYRPSLYINGTRYLVHTAACHMIEWPIYDEETGPMFRDNRAVRDWKCDKPVVSIERVNYTGVYIASLTNNSSLKCYADELRSNDGDEYTFGDRFGPFKSSVTHFPKLSAVRVECFKPFRPLNSTQKYQVKVESKILPLVPKKSPKYPPSPDSNIPNVLILGIDSISWLNFRRYFTKTKKLFEQHQFVPLYGFTKIGDNTFPNLMGVLTGNHYTKYWNQSIRWDMTFDAVPLIWKRFAAKGHLTALIEDMPGYALFNYGRSGFAVPPTDYYLRPVSMLVDDDLNNSFCYKDKLGIEYYYSWILDQITALHNRSQPFFTMSHMADLTHNIFWNAGHADKPVHSLLSSLFERKINRNTFIVVFSDHGIRFGHLRQTRSGQIEERLPFVYVYVPEQFNLDAKKSRKALRRNAHRLTSHFDLHATLRHIVEGSSPKDEPYGHSLFTTIPRNRTCESAGISENWCLCSHFGKFKGSEQLKRHLGQFVVDQINQVIHDQPKCAPLELDHLEQVFIRTEPESIDGSDMFALQVRLKPGGGLFDATVRLNRSALVRDSRKYDNYYYYDKTQMANSITHRQPITLMGEISRLDKYGDQSDCIDDFVREKYCFCKIHLKVDNKINLIL